MTVDLTTITTPFGLLDEATQKALRECGGPWLWYDEDGDWHVLEGPSWSSGFVYRLKPQPPKPREWWMKHGYWSMPVLEGDDVAYLKSQGFILVREVLE
jgi:hypothetical protein